MGDAKAYANTEDVGRFEVTKKDEDKFVFKVPSLRNIALTAPYFHDGKAAKLGDAVSQMADLQRGEKLSDEQVADIVAFLGALSDKERVKPAAAAGAEGPVKKMLKRRILRKSVAANGCRRRAAETSNPKRQRGDPCRMHSSLTLRVARGQRNPGSGSRGLEPTGACRCATPHT